MPAKNLSRINKEATYSHIYNKGVEGRAIFGNEADYQAFVGFLKDYLSPQDPKNIKKDFKIGGKTFQGTPHLPKNYLNDIELVAYSLNPNQFNLILHQKTSGSIERFLRSLCTRYSMYFNKKYQRSGSLFEGPYKSVQIRDERELTNLTASLHHMSKNSSYPEYLGTRTTPWVKPQIVLSRFKETANYKDFVEKYRLDQPDQKEEERTETHQLERSNLEESNLASEPVRSRMPQFLAMSTLIYVLLAAFSLRNIYVSKALSYQSSPAPAVLGEIQESPVSATPLAATPQATSAATIEATPSASAKPETKPEISLRVKIDDGSSFVNIRQKPTVTSEKIGQAHDGDNFKFISLQAGWYEIKLTDGSTGFISAKYALKEETN